jgi:hypothetical protein|tara:strand:- start:492 stop:671 length:180 start_codon:yes stop_codon:yes gene_type:complete
MDDYGKFITYMDMNYSISDVELNDMMRDLVTEYDNVSMDDWFEDEPLVEKKIPEFNFVK